MSYIYRGLSIFIIFWVNNQYVKSAYGILFIIRIEFSEGFWKLNIQQRDCVHMFAQKASQGIFTHLKMTDHIPFVNPIAQTRAVGEMQWNSSNEASITNTACDAICCRETSIINTHWLAACSGWSSYCVYYYQQERVFVKYIFHKSIWKK